jgi:hypothetical protein
MFDQILSCLTFRTRNKLSQSFREKICGELYVPTYFALGKQLAREQLTLIVCSADTQWKQLGQASRIPRPVAPIVGLHHTVCKSDV